MADSVAPENESMNVVPGLIGLNLSILHAIDMHMIDNAKQTIYKLIRKEHDIVENVQRNLVALLKTRIPREKIEARRELEVLVHRFPKQLNALADLEYIYRGHHRMNDAEKCRIEIDNILSSDTKEDMEAKRTCLLEQGYVILIERTIVNENTVELRITDLHKILTIEHDKSDGKRREYLGRGIHHQKQVLRSFHNANKDDAADGHLARKRSSLDKFEMAEKLIKKPFSDAIWEHYYAKALNQYYDSLEDLSKFKGGLEDEMRDVTIEAIEKFWFVASMPIKPGIRTLIARSYGYIGHILIKRANMVRDHFQRHKKLKVYLDNPLKALETAYSLKADDTSVLNRYGRSLWNIAFKIQDETKQSDRLLCLEKAEKMLSNSIENDNYRNWFAYSTRMLVRLKIADSCDTFKECDKAHIYLQHAREDGLVCFQSQNTRRDMSVLAEVCQKLAKFPNTTSYGPEFVKDKRYIWDAVDYLFYATHLGDPIDYHWTSRIAVCLFDLGEYDQAIEWQRKTWFLSTTTSNHSFFFLCKYMLTKYERDNILKTKAEVFLKEFLYTLVYAKHKYGSIKECIEGLYSTKRKELTSVLNAVIIQKRIPIREEEKYTLQHCIDILSNKATSKNHTRELEKVRKLHLALEVIVPTVETEYLLSDIFQHTSLKPIVEGIKTWSKFSKYDFFVCHSHKDADWVNNILLRHLESAFDEQDIAFKGCIADRDFTPGVSVLQNILDAIKESHRVILVLTSHFIDSNWCQYEADHAIIQSLELNTGSNFVIPVMKEKCTVPNKLLHLNYADMTIEQDLVREMRRLKRALLPDEE